MNEKEREFINKKEREFIKEFIELIEKYGMILCFPGFLKGNALVVNRDNDITSQSYEDILGFIKNL